MNFVNIEDSLGNSFELNFKIDIVLVVFYLPKLFVGYNIYIKTKYISNVFKLKQLLVYKRINLNIDLAITLHVGTAIADKDRIGPIELLIGRKVESIEIVINIKR